MWKTFKFKNIQFLIFSYSVQFYAYFMKLVWFSIFRSDAKQKFQWKFVFHTKGSPWQKMKWITKKCRSSPSEVFLGKDVLEICSKFTGEHPYQSVISIKLLCNFFEITFRHVLLLKQNVLRKGHCVKYQTIIDQHIAIHELNTKKKLPIDAPIKRCS